VDYANADTAVAKLDKALAKKHMLAVNVSDARAVFNLDGKSIRDVLAKGSPADMSKHALEVGDIRRTRIGQLPVAFWFDTETTATVVCFRSVGEHIFDWLKTAAQKGTTPDFH
jgi:sarcosine oxidase subunit gamma